MLQYWGKETASACWAVQPEASGDLIDCSQLQNFCLKPNCQPWSGLVFSTLLLGLHLLCPALINTCSLSWLNHKLLEGRGCTLHWSLLVYSRGTIHDERMNFHLDPSPCTGTSHNPFPLPSTLTTIHSGRQPIHLCRTAVLIGCVGWFELQF